MGLVYLPLRSAVPCGKLIYDFVYTRPKHIGHGIVKLI